MYLQSENYQNYISLQSGSPAKTNGGSPPKSGNSILSPPQLKKPTPAPVQGPLGSDLLKAIRDGKRRVWPDIHIQQLKNCWADIAWLVVRLVSSLVRWLGMRYIGIFANEFCPMNKKFLGVYLTMITFAKLLQALTCERWRTRKEMRRALVAPQTSHPFLRVASQLRCPIATMADIPTQSKCSKPLNFNEFFF